jgi:hypothetical protein
MEPRFWGSRVQGKSGMQESRAESYAICLSIYSITKYFTKEGIIMV